MNNLLQLIPGRVVSTLRAQSAVLVEYNPHKLPARGTFLRAPKAILEVTHHVSQSEVQATLRHGALPPTNTQLEKTLPLLLPSPSDLFGQWITASGQDHEGNKTVPLQATLSNTPAQEENCLSTPHPGQMLYAPLVRGSSLALTGDHPQDFRKMGEDVIRALVQENPNLCVLYLRCPSSPRLKSLPGERTLEIAASWNTSAGESALAFRALKGLAKRLTEDRLETLVVLDNPAHYVSAWRTTNPNGLGASALAAEHFASLVASVPHAGDAPRTLLALLPEDPTAPPLPGAGGYLPTRIFASSARFSSGSLEPSECHTTWEKNAAMRRKALETLSTIHELSDYALIFGKDELDDNKRAELERAEALQRILCQGEGSLEEARAIL